MTIKFTNNEFIQKANIVHQNKYDYSLVNYINSNIKIIIICKEHGQFIQSPIKHLSGQGCKSCGYNKLSNKYKDTKDEFIKKSILVHGNLYDYSLVKYIDSKIKVKIFCIKCKEEFEQMPYSHISGKGHEKCCQNSGNSKEQKEILDWIKSVYLNEIIERDRKIISPLEIDITIPDKMFGIEYNGLYWHSEEFKESDYHLNKTVLCSKSMYKLFHIFSDEWIFKKEIIKSMISHRLQLSKKIGARKLKVKQIQIDEAKSFFENTHISGFVGAQLYLALVNENNEIQCAISFRKPIQKIYGNNTIEIARFSNQLNTSVQGGFQKLLKASIRILKNKGFDKILTYADLRFGTGSVYLKSGFKLLGQTSIDYWYTNGTKRENRFKYRADKENLLTEKQVTINNNVKKIYGCGSNIYLLDI